MITESKYRLLVETLKSDISGGKYRTGKSFPSIRALIRRFSVSKTTVQRALDELYHQGLISREQGRGTFVTRNVGSRKIGLIIPGVAYSEFFSVLVSAFSRLAQEREYTLLFGDVMAGCHNERVKLAKAFAADLVKQNVAGVIYQPLKSREMSFEINSGILSSFEVSRIPVVLMDTDLVSQPLRSSYDVVSIDNVNAGETLARHLIERGARNIAFHMRPCRIPSVRDRYRGVVLAKAELGCGIKKTWSDVLVCEPDDANAIERYMRRKPRPDAFICENDTAAAVFSKTLEGLGHWIPGDVMVAGFDDVRIAKLTSPTLTTVRQPCEELASVAFERLLARIAAPLMPASIISLQAELVVRESSARGLSSKTTKRRRLANGHK